MSKNFVARISTPTSKQRPTTVSPSFLFSLPHGYLLLCVPSLHLLLQQSNHTIMALSLRSLFFSPILKIPSPKLTPPTTNVILSLNKTPKSRKCHAVTDMSGTSTVHDHKVLVGPASAGERKGERQVADYDWTKEWYPLYLTKDVPDDAPLGLTVFDQQIVLYKDGNGELRCYQDRCPHR